MAIAACCSYFGLDAFVFAGPDLWQRDAMRALFCCQTIKIDGQAEFCCQSVTKLLGALDAILDVDALSSRECSSIQVTIADHLQPNSIDSIPGRG